MVTKIADKKFVGKGIIHAAVWKKGDLRTIYHMIYQHSKGGPSYMKRFAVNAITRDKEYDLTSGGKDPKIHYFSVNPNGRREIVSVKLRPRPKLKKLKFDIDFGELMIKGRGSKGNLTTKHFISKIELKETGGSTLAAREIWWDSVVRRLNNESRGNSLGTFKGDDKILTIYQSGHFKLSGFELTNKFDDDLIHIEKWHSNRPLACVYYNGDKEIYYVKRFLIEATSKKTLFIPDNSNCQLTVASTQYLPKVKIEFNKRLKETKDLSDKVEELNALIDLKGMKAQGNQLTKLKVKDVVLLPPLENEQWPVEQEVSNDAVADEDQKAEVPDKLEDKEVLGNLNEEKSVEIELDVNSNKSKPDGQINLF